MHSQMILLLSFNEWSKKNCWRTNSVKVSWYFFPMRRKNLKSSRDPILLIWKLALGQNNTLFSFEKGGYFSRTLLLLLIELQVFFPLLFSSSRDESQKLFIIPRHCHSDSNKLIPSNLRTSPGQMWQCDNSRQPHCVGQVKRPKLQMKCSFLLCFFQEKASFLDPFPTVTSRF